MASFSLNNSCAVFAVVEVVCVCTCIFLNTCVFCFLSVYFQGYWLWITNWPILPWRRLSVHSQQNPPFSDILTATVASSFSVFISPFPDQSPHFSYLPDPIPFSFPLHGSPTPAIISLFSCFCIYSQLYTHTWDAQLGSPDKREHVMFAHLEYLTFS